ncbi:hypothetical protein QTP70_003127 [Hemibagrus guttatus]|uniref:ribonuclease H n=1 Tax=Hemibagrus guttatus TaxID=175788 RepID=A0AAE0UWY8_9TELE|nr:hypothetical protein QTP70_003127 [Hemibagrus guttatus]
MERRKVDILCVQETRWKGSKARSIGAGFKLFYYGVDSKRNGVGVVLKEEFVRNVLEVKRVSDRVMNLKLEIEGVMLNVVSGYAPQVGCELEEKERFWSELDEVMESIPTGERVVIGADFNGHVGEGNRGDEEVMGKFGVKERNLEGQMVVDFAKRMDMGVVNTYFQKREEHRVTYKSGGRSTQVDYILCRRGNLKEISDCKVVVGESVARQHRMVVCRMTLMVCKKKRSEIEKKTKWWKLKKEECCEEFRQKLRQALGGQVVLPDDWETTAEVIRETGRKVLGVSSGRRKEDKETWWWNEEVQDSIQRKRLAKKKWDMDRTEENRQEYKELQRRVKREVSKAKQKAYDELYTRLDTREGEKDLYRLARQRDRDGKDVQQVRVIKDRDGRVLTSVESVQRRWKEYFEELMNEENEREKRVEGVNSVEQKVDKIRKDEVRKALKRMKSGKAVGPDDIPVEVWKCLGEAAVEFLASLFNRVLESERMPEEWRRSVLVPIFKNKGDVQSCSNYRGIKLMSHTMKVWERVVEARLRKVVEICEQQYGFMPRKSTTDAIFALRILMEKYRDGQRELHCVFVDLEKAYDRVPREELWYCMRKSGIAEKYVRVVQDMYERSRTVVRCAVGQTEEFNVEVGLHQGSALSPFLFAIVMDQLSEEVRQESPWTMMFADEIVICSESREQVEENLERWRFALERRGMKVSRSKTEYMCVNERKGSGTVRLQGEEVKKVQEFKYLGSTVQSNGECGKEVKKRVQAGWNGWRKVSGVLCDQKISARIKGKVYRTVVRPAMLYGLETVSLRKRQESELEVAELKMLRFSLGVTRLDRIRNEYIRGTAHVGRLGDKVREARLRWFGHVQRRESEYIGRRMLDMKLPGRRQRGRPKRRLVLWSGLDAGSVVLFDSDRGFPLPFEGVISEGPAVRIQFITDKPNNQNTGFSIHYEAFEKGHCYEPYIQNGNFSTTDPTYGVGAIVQFSCEPGHSLEQGPPVIECINTRDPYWNDTEPLCKALCGGDLSGPSGLILSPNWPDWYGEGEDCSWRIHVGEEKRILLDVQLLNLSNSDMLTILDGDEVNAHILGQYMGGNSPFKLTSSTPDLTITFHSDPAGLVFGKGEGFIINYMEMNPAELLQLKAIIDHQGELLQLCQGCDSAADYVVQFMTLVAQSSWNNTALLAVFQEGLHPALQVEMA